MNEFFAKVELLAGLSEEEQTELRTNIGMNSIIDDLSNDTISTKALKVYENVLIDTSNLKLRLGESTSNMFLKSMTADGEAAWSPLPRYDEMVGFTMASITKDLFDDLSNLRKLKVDDQLQLRCNIEKPSVLVNEDSNGLVFWSELNSTFDYCNLRSNEVPNMLALGALYDMALSNDSNLYANLYDVATDTSLVLTLSNNLSELSNNVPDVMSNLGLDINLTTSNLLSSNVVASNIETNLIAANEGFVGQFRASNILVHENATVTGELQSKSVTTSDLKYDNILQGKDVFASNVNVDFSISTSNLTATYIDTNSISLNNIHFDIASASNNVILSVFNSNIAFKQLNSDYLASSEDSIPSSKALKDALQFMDSRVQTITTDPAFSETYLQINCNLDEIKYYTVENMLKLHSNLRLSKLAREPIWENIENIPSDLANLSEFYLTKDLSNMDLGDINVLKLRTSLALEEMAYQKSNDVDIRGGFIQAERVEAHNFLMTDSDNNVEDDRINYRDETYLYMRHAGHEGLKVPGTGKWTNLPIKQYYTDIGKNSIPSCDALSNLYTFVINDRVVAGFNESNEPIVQTGFLNNSYSNQSSTSNAASTKAVSDLYAFMRSGNGGDSGFLNPEYKGQSSDSNAATTKALSAFHDFVRSHEGGDQGFLNDNFKGQTSHSNAASTKALTDLHDFMISSEENGFLRSSFSNQTSHSNAATAKSVTDLFNYIIDGFLVKDYTQGNEETAATSGAVFNLFQYINSSNFVSASIDDGGEGKIAAANTLSNLYFQTLASEDFFKTHNPYIFQDYLKQSIDDKSSTQPFSSTATSNVIHGMITERNKLYNALNDDGVLNNHINDNDFGKIATAQSVYNLSNNTTIEINKLHNSIYDNLKKNETNLGLFDRIRLTDSQTNPLEIVRTNNCNIDIGLKYNPKYFTLTGGGQFTLDDAAISNIATSVIKIRSSSEDAGFSNLIEVDPVGDGEYEIKFRGTALLDEISGDVAKSVADAILNYGAGEYTFSSNLWVKKDMYVYSNIHASDAHFSNIDVKHNLIAGDIELSNSLSVHGEATFENNVTILSNSTVSGNAMIQGYQNIASTLSVHGNMYADNDIRAFANAVVGGKLSVSEDTLLGGTLSVGGNAMFATIVQASNVNVAGTLSAAALQELHDQLQAEKLKVADLLTRVQALEATAN